MMTQSDVLNDRIKTLEGQIIYMNSAWTKVEELKKENAILQSKIQKLEKQNKHLKQELEFA